jgi:DNA-directed RNA polymerase specialized sigma54-like protein
MQNVIPDVIVEKVDGGVRVTVNDDGMPSPRWLKRRLQSSQIGMVQFPAETERLRGHRMTMIRL